MDDAVLRVVVLLNGHLLMVWGSWGVRGRGDGGKLLKKQPGSWDFRRLFF